MTTPQPSPPRRAVIAAGAGLAVAATMASCSTPAPEPSAEPSASTAVPVPAPSSAPAVQEYYEGLPKVGWDESAKKAASDAAVKALAAYVNTGKGRDPWWAGYGPLLDPGYAEDAFYIDPERITIKHGTHMEVLNPSQNPLTVTVRWETNDGPWVMLLHRTGPEAPWLLSQFSREGGQ